MPLRLFLHPFSNSSLLNSLTPSNFPNSGGNFPSLRYLSKCSFKILSIPEGREGNIESGLLTFLLKCSQKHLGQSFNKDNDDGENLYGILARRIISIFKLFEAIPNHWTSPKPQNSSNIGSQKPKIAYFCPLDIPG